MEIKLDGEYQTRDGREVRVIDVDSPVSSYPIVGYVNTCGDWQLYSWTREGIHHKHVTPADIDLIPVPKKRKRTYWLVHYDNGAMSSYIGESTVDYLRENHRPDTLAITGPHEIEFVEGQGLVSVTLESEGGEG